jgi:hypothetical protein
METFIEGLQANRSLEKLDFTRCDFDAEVATFLESVVLSPTKRGAFSTCPIRELSVKQNDDGLLVALLTLIFSNLQDLNWYQRNREVSSDAFWNRLQAGDTSKIPLQSLCLEYWPIQKCDAMNKCIPKMVNLRGLYFSELSSNDPEYLSRHEFMTAMQSFMNAVKQSTCLRQLQVGELESRLLNAALLRNRLRPQLLARPRLDHLIQDGEDGTDLYLYPSLFSVSQQSPYGALNAILTGLLALSDDTGPK